MYFTSLQNSSGQIGYPAGHQIGGGHIQGYGAVSWHKLGQGLRCPDAPSDFWKKSTNLMVGEKVKKKGCYA